MKWCTKSWVPRFSVLLCPFASLLEHYLRAQQMLSSKNNIQTFPLWSKVPFPLESLKVPNTWPWAILGEIHHKVPFLSVVWKISCCYRILIKLAPCRDGKRVVINYKGSFSWEGSFWDENCLPVFLLHQWYSNFFYNFQLCTSQSAEKWEFAFLPSWENILLKRMRER